MHFNRREMENKRWLAIIGVAVVVIIIAMIVVNTTRRDPVSFALITTSDLQSQIVPFETEIDGRKLTVGGFARIASAARKAREGADQYLILSSGDDLIAPLLTVFGGVPEMIGMSAAGYITAAPGNHEFDRGDSVFATALKHAGFRVVASNMEFEHEYLKERVKKNIQWNLGDKRVFIFGLMTPDFVRVTNARGVSVDEDIITVARKQVEIGHAASADIIVAITHIGLDLDRKLAAEVPGIDIIVGGHSHEFAYETVGKTIIVQDGAKGSHLGVLRFELNDGAIVEPSWELVLLDSTVGADAEIDSIMNTYWSAMNDSLGQPVGSALVGLDARKSSVRAGESNLGDMIADSWLGWFAGADIALVTGGSIRGDQIYPAGELTYLDINSIMPFRNEVLRTELTGAQLARTLELSASAIHVEGDDCPDSCRVAYGGFLQVAGVRFTIDLSKAPFKGIFDGRNVSSVIDSGDRVSNIKVKSGDKWLPIDPILKYDVLVNSWTASGGDGHYVFLDSTVVKTPTSMYSTDVLAGYIEKHNPVAPKTDGRIDLR